MSLYDLLFSGPEGPERLAAALERQAAEAAREGDPYVEEADANPERRDNGCMIYKVSDAA